MHCRMCLWFVEADKQSVAAVCSGLCTFCYNDLQLIGDDDFDPDMPLEDVGFEDALLDSFEESLDSLPPLKKRRLEKDVSVSKLEDGEAGGTCSICLEEMDGEDVKVMPCSTEHKFHLGCISQWLEECEATCPLCKAEVN